jgi:hypothetical protein
MSTFKVTVERLTILPHPHANKLELAQVGLYRAVVGMGQFKDGDYAIYIPEGAILPPDLIQELGLTGRLAGKAQNRVEAVRLQGELSQGIVCLPHALEAYFENERIEAYTGEFWMSYQEWLKLEAESNDLDINAILGITQHIREAVGGRAILKSVSDDYLTRKGGTEYE